jgi:serine/threonine protein kinase
LALSPGDRLGAYEILSLLGAGGMGEVYRARDTRLDRTVAIKVLPGHVASDPVLKQRFEQEARALAALSHSHICQIFDIGRAIVDDEVLSGHSARLDSTPSDIGASVRAGQAADLLVMEYLEGETLAQRLGKGALSVNHALVYAIDLADALDKADRKGVVHRDLKPGNVMLTAGTR